MPPRKKTPITHGDCYEAAGKYLMDECLVTPGCGLVLVHGEVSGQGVLEGLTYGHAWVLDGETVIDKSNGRNMRIPRALYYTLGHIGDNLHRYTWEETRVRLMKYKHWGPWELVTRSGL